MTLGEKLKAIRQSTGQSAEDVAEKMGWAPSTIYRWEADKVRPSWERVSQLLDELGARPGEVKEVGDLYVGREP